MPEKIDTGVLDTYRQRLHEHPVYKAVTDIPSLRCFMQHHVYSVWDFMSLIKYLQSVVAPATTPWNHAGDVSVRRFINELVLEEESDQAYEGEGHTSHFDLYRKAMHEIGADTYAIDQFVKQVTGQNVHDALHSGDVPEASRCFTRTTFEFIESGKPHAVAAALALGREHIIPDMFRSILASSGVSEQQAPVFHYYLKRHIHLDEDFHAPLSLRLLNGLCRTDEQRHEALLAAESAVNARLLLWDGVQAAIQELP